MQKTYQKKCTICKKKFIAYSEITEVCLECEKEKFKNKFIEI